MEEVVYKIFGVLESNGDPEEGRGYGFVPTKPPVKVGLYSSQTGTIGEEATVFEHTLGKLEGREVEREAGRGKLEVRMSVLACWSRGGVYQLCPQRVLRVFFESGRLNFHHIFTSGKRVDYFECGFALSFHSQVKGPQTSEKQVCLQTS